jgi:hypothetical protein
VANSMADHIQQVVVPRSQIPVPVSRRHSLNILQQSTNSVNSTSTGTSSRAASPSYTKPPLLTAKSSNGALGSSTSSGGGKRYSLLPAGNGRKPSLNDKDEDTCKLL